MAAVPAEGHASGPGKWLQMALVGVAAGLLAGLFGVGGGIIMVPLMVLLLGMGQRVASSTSLLAIVPIAAAAAWGYAMSGNVALVSGLLLLVGGVVGGQIGGWALPRVPTATLQIWFGILSIATAARLLLPVGSGDGTGLIQPDTVIGVAALVGVGLAAGILAGLLGVGGGIILVPALVLLTGASADVARGTSLLVVVGTALVTSVRLFRGGFVDGRVAAVAGFCGAPAGLLGAKLGQLLPERIALLLFSALLVYSGVRSMRIGQRNRRAALAVAGEADDAAAQ